jgi:UDP-GlcNAc:undecaprenyl-phosphate GlcNAc-1-phosphate transferase
VAHPAANRAHQTSTPLMGGLALYIGLTVPMVVFVGAVHFIAPEQIDLSLSDWSIIVVSGTLLMLIGLWDDWKTLDSRTKLLLEFLAVIIVPVATEAVKIQMRIPELINLVLTVLWFLYLINAVNYQDNMDGTAATIAVVAAMFFMVISVINGQFLVASLSAAVAGTAFGFLRYNLFDSNRKIFMGDSGALFLGFMLAVIGIILRFEAESPWITWPVPVLILGVPIFDTGLVFISRTRRGQSFFEGGIDHTSHRLARIGMGRFGVPFALGLMGSALGCAAILVMHSDLMNSIAIQLFVALAGLYVFYRLEIRPSYEFRTGKIRPAEEPAVSEELSPNKAMN